MEKLTSDRLAILDTALKSFAKAASKEESEVTVPDELQDGILNRIKADGKQYYAWEDLKSLIQAFLISRISLQHDVFPVDENNGEISFEKRKDTILALLENFDSGAPFTLQRLVEVLSTEQPSISTTKYLNSIEKLLSVTSVLTQVDAEGNAVVNQTTTMNVVPDLVHPPSSLMSSASVGILNKEIAMKATISK